jgi:hypothetical protein
MPLFGPLLVALLSLLPAATRSGPTPVGPPPTDPPVSTVAPTGRCPQWEQTAIDAGFDINDWPTLDRILWCESNCQPGAHNRSGASGLAQIMPMHWHGRDPYDPATNLAMAKEVHDQQGWRAWSCY